MDRNDTSDLGVVAMARLLQSCDDDNDSRNGLKIRQEVKDAFSAEVDFNAADLDAYAVEANLTLVDEALAVEHLTQTTELVEAVNDATIPQVIKDALLTPSSALTQDLKDALAYMGNEERLAYDVYNKLYESSPSVNQLSNIASKSEIVHIESVQLLVRKYIANSSEFTNTDLNDLEYKDVLVADMTPGVYDISRIQDLYDALVAKGQASDIDALEVGCMVEVTDINDLDDYIALSEDANATDVTSVFTSLRNGSYSHYWAFDKGLANHGVANGCCSLGVVDGVDYCQPLYPQK